MSNTFKFMRSYKLTSWSAYPYLGYVSTCNYNNVPGILNTVGNGYATVPSYNNGALKN
jgi:hypothetical protein